MDLTLKEFEGLSPKQLKEALRDEAIEIAGENSLACMEKRKNSNDSEFPPKQVDGPLKRLLKSLQNASQGPALALKNLFQRS